MTHSIIPNWLRAVWPQTKPILRSGRSSLSRTGFAALLVMSSGGLLASCHSVSSELVDTDTPSVEIVQAEASAPEDNTPPPPPSFSAALDMYQPLGPVEGAEQVTPLTPIDSTDRFADAVAYAESMQSFSFMVWHQGELVHEQYFAPFDAELRPESASMHKSVLALVVGAAINDGHITSVDEPISTYVTEWQNEPRGEITIAHLLQMASGLEPLSFEGGAKSEAMAFNMGLGVRETVLGRDLVHEPGAIFHYAGVSSQLLGLIIERATESPYAEYLSQSIWKPLGADEAFVWYTEPDGFPRTHTALLAKAQDWLRLGLLIKDGGYANGQQIVPSAYIDAMVTPSKTNPNYGYQIWLGTEYHPIRYYNEAKIGLSVAASEPFAIDDLIYLDGFGGQRVYVSKSLDLVIVRTGEVRMDWDDAKLPNLVAAALGVR